MGCGETCCKVLSGIFTFLFTVGSIGIVAFAGFVTYMILDTLSAETSSKTQAAIPAIVTLVLGLLLFCIVFMACCALCRDSTTCLEAYGAVLIVLAIAHLGIGIYAVNKYKPINEFTLGESQISFSIDLAPDSTRNFLKTYIERDIRTYEYQDREKYNRVKDWYNDCTSNCAEDITNFIIGTNLLLGGLDICFAAVEVIGAICAFCLSCTWRKGRSDW